MHPTAHDYRLAAERNWYQAMGALDALARRRHRANPPHVREAIETLFDICVEEEQDAWDRYQEINQAIEYDQLR
jgi:hypothetical protein